jgi:hypothetical protein
MLQLTPLLAGEPHRLTFSHATDDAACGDYYWYEIAQPNGEPLRSPEDSFVQLIFAGGKHSLNGADENPYIAQRVSGDLVAIDPSGYMNGGSLSSSGSCLLTDVLYDASANAGGRCCVRQDGAYATFVASEWDESTFVCTGVTPDEPEPESTPPSSSGGADAQDPLPDDSVDVSEPPDDASGAVGAPESPGTKAGETPRADAAQSPGALSQEPGGVSAADSVEPSRDDAPSAMGCSMHRGRSPGYLARNSRVTPRLSSAAI